MILSFDNHIHNFYLGRYIVGYTVGNHILRPPSCVTVKQKNFDIYPNEHHTTGRLIIFNRSNVLL